MEIKYSFQSDSEIVKKAYSKLDNFHIEYDENISKEYCAIYFSSNNIYFPNNVETFEKNILKKNKFEWYSTRIKNAQKHIFIRDIKKQWYLEGINEKINNPEKLLSFLLEETKGYKVITLGSSSGGFSAVLFGQQLNAEKIFTFNGQFEINSLLHTSSENIDPIIFRNKENKFLLQFYDIRKFIKEPQKIYYFFSLNSTWDYEQSQIANIEINKIKFLTSHHGIPFFKSLLPIVINMNSEKILKLKKKKQFPILFSLRLAGLPFTIKESFFAIRKKINSLIGK